MSLLIVQLSHEETPLPDVPIILNGTPEVTDELGQVAKVFVSASRVRIESGQPAVVFEPVEDYGINLELQNPIELPAAPLVVPSSRRGSQCEVLVGNTRSVLLRYVNYSPTALEIPNSGMNWFNAATDATPPTLFAPGMNTFFTPLDSFLSGESYSGSWNLLGARVDLIFPLPVCTDSGVAGECRMITGRHLKPLKDFVKASVERYKEEVSRIVDHTRMDRETRQEVLRWRENFEARAVRVTKSVTNRLNSIRPPVFDCEAPPPQCVERTFPRPTLQYLFSRLFRGRTPAPMRELRAASRRDQKQFTRIMKRLPEVYQRCPTY